MLHFLIISITLLFFTCCTSPDEQRSEKAKQLPEAKAVDLFAVDSVYKPFFPDTNFTFNNYKDLFSYRKQIMMSLDSFSKKILETNNNSDSVKLANISASHHITDLLEVVTFKFFRTANRDAMAMDMISFSSPYSNTISMEQRHQLFNTFPKELQNSKAGKAALIRIQEGIYDKNIGYNIAVFDQLKLKDTASQDILFKNIFVSNHDYYLLMLGASWCHPCREEEFQMKHWLSAIDTSKLKLVALSIDTKEKKWIEYIRNDNNPWSSYLLENGWDNNTVKKLGVSSIPRNFLINNKKQVVMEHADLRKIIRKYLL